MVTSKQTNNIIKRLVFQVNRPPSLPQKYNNRIRSIILLTRKDLKYKWNPPSKNKEITTLKKAIGNLPSLDPLIYDISYKKHLEIFPDYEKKVIKAHTLSKWHTPPKHVYRQVISMLHTPSGKSAFDNNDKYKPKKRMVVL